MTRTRSEEPVTVPGFRAAGVHCGIKEQGLDLALLVADAPAATAGVFTRSTVVGAPVEISRERVRAGRTRGVVVNSGISNVAMGAAGVRAARSMSEAAAATVGAEPESMLVASTGVIGEPLPIGKVRRGIRAAARVLRPEGWDDAAHAILTTDTVAKLAVRRFRLGRAEVTLAGIAKGSGMIEPNMATMLSFLATDAAVAPPLLRRLLRRTADGTYNRLTIDGEGSTSDSVILFAGGSAGNPVLRDERSAAARVFAKALDDVALELTRALAQDGEGATKLVTVRVRGARTAAQAERAARRIANSLLVKTAVFGRDPNWGRILQTLGAERIDLALAKTEVRLCGVCVFRRGTSAGPAARKRAGARMAAAEVPIEVQLGRGRHEATVVTCDLTYDYVRINAEYTT